MAKLSVPSTSDKRLPTTNGDSDTLADSRGSRLTRSKRGKKQKNVHEEQPSNMPTKNLKREQSHNEKLEKVDLKSRFSYAPKKRRAQSEADDNDHSIENVKLSLENTDRGTNGEVESSGANERDTKSFMPKSDFSIKFPSSVVSLTETGSKIVKSYSSSVRDSKNIMYYVTRISQGEHDSTSVKQIRKRPIISHVARMQRFAHQSPFQRRVTALTFHAKYPSLLAAGSKGGEIVLWDTDELGHKLEIPGVGPGGSILGLKFHHENPMIVYTASLTGTVLQQDFLGKDNMVFFDTKDFDIWFTSVDISVPHKLLVAGDTQGCLHLANLDGKKLWKINQKIHKGKVTHVEFSAWDPYIFVTASLDHTVRIWDLRMFSDSSSKGYQSLHCLTHEKAVNSAYFSPSNGTSLLTTDQYNELRVYTAPMWHLENTIPHPHRQFQHLTGIKAQWHPLEDLIVVGRYPDNKFCPSDFRSIDIYNAHTGQREHYFDSNGIVSLNAFSPNGDVLVSASGTNMILWKPKEMCKDSVGLSTLACPKLLQTHGVSRSRSNNSSKSKPAASKQWKKQKSSKH